MREELSAKSEDTVWKTEFTSEHSKHLKNRVGGGADWG